MCIIEFSKQSVERRFVRKCLISVSQKSVCFLRKLIAEYLGGTYRHLLYVLAGLRCAKVEANENLNFKEH